MSAISRRALLGASLALIAGRRPDVALASDSPAPAARPLRFGLTPVILNERVAFLHEWGAWLAARLGRPVGFVQRATYREILGLLLRGGLDVAWICGYPYVQHRAELTLVAVPRFQGRPLYRSYIVVGADSPYDSLGALKGRLFAWSDPDSNSGYLFPRYRLAELGEDPERFFRRSFFAWGHRHCVEAVAEGLSDGAAVDGYIWETLAVRDAALTRRTRWVLRSPLFGFPPIVAAPALPDAQVQALRAVLLSQSDDPLGLALLRELNLDGFAAEAPALFDDIARMAATLGKTDRA